MFSIKKFFRSISISFTLLSFLIPFSILTLFLLFYKAGYADCLLPSFSLTQIILSSLASMFFFILSSFCSFFKTDYKYFYLFLACSYGLSSYNLASKTSVNTLCIYALFPLLYLFFEKVVEGTKYSFFIFALIIFFLLDPGTTMSLLIFLVPLYIIESIINKSFSLANLLHFVSCIFLSFLVSGIKTIPHIAACLTADISYAGFRFTYSPTVFLSRFLPGSISSLYLSSEAGIDIYFGMLPLILMLLFFFEKQISKKTRIGYGFFYVLLIAAVELSPFSYIINLITAENNFPIIYAFLITFFSLRLAFYTRSLLQTPRRSSLFFCTITALCLIVISLAGSLHNFHSLAITSIIIFFILYCFLLVTLLFSKSMHNISKSLLILCSFLELFCNIFLISNKNTLPVSPSTEASSIFADSADISSSPQAPSSAALTYETFSSAHSNAKTISILNSLMQNVSPTASEYEAYTNTNLPNFFEKINARCYKIGAKEPLFTPVNSDFVFSPSNEYAISNMSNHIYHLHQRNTISGDNIYVSYTINTDKNLTAPLYIYNDYTSELMEFDQDFIENESPAFCCFYAQENLYINFQLLSYSLNTSLLEQLPDMIAASKLFNTSLQFSDYLALTSSILGILLLLLLYFNSSKEKIYTRLYSAKAQIAAWKFPVKLKNHLYKFRIYYLAFFIPIIFFIGSMVIFDCIPFGANSFLDGDGLFLTLPTYLDYYHNIQQGNQYLSMNGGFGYSLYATNPILWTLSFYKYFSPGQIAILLHLGVALCLGLSSIFTVFYLTHRLRGMAADKNSISLLIPALAYSLCSYMLVMRGFSGWYFTLCAFPLLILSMDYLIYRKKLFPYIAILSYCIITNLYLALYMCIFLVIYYFTYSFSSKKDFIKKGIRFALCSLLSAGNSLFVISNTLLSAADSPYQEKDSIFPSLGFHTNFFNQWKQHMIFSPYEAVTSDDGAVSLFCGILTLLLVLSYFFSKKILLKAKIKILIPIIIMYITFNGRVLSYLWNGLHYQSKVPNRYAFLLIFLLATIAYDGICCLNELGIKKYTLLTVFLSVFFVLCYLLSDSCTLLALICSLVLCLIYWFIYFIFHFKQKRQKYYSVFIIIFCLELFSNIIFITSGYALNSILLIQNFEQENMFIEDNLKKGNDYFRISFPSSLTSNTGCIYNVGCNNLFNSFVTRHQLNTSRMFGFYFTTNAMSANYESSPLGLSLSATRYLFIPSWSNMALHDLSNYKYLGKTYRDYIFENEDALSLGYYVPYETPQLTSPSNMLLDFYNEFAALYSENSETLFNSTTINYSESGSSPNSFWFTDNDGNLLTYEDAYDLYMVEREKTSMGPINALRLHINYQPSHSGYQYFCTNELVAIGSSSADANTQVELPFPNSSTDFLKSYVIVSLNETLLKDVLNQMQKQQLQNVIISNDTITGTTNYTTSGYTLFSLAWERGWHAYIDGHEVEIEDPFNSVMMIKTPAGQHTLQLKYIPYGMKTSKLISFSFWIVTFIICFILRRKK